MPRSKKGKKKGSQGETEAPGSQQQQPSGSQQQQQQQQRESAPLQQTQQPAQSRDKQQQIPQQRPLAPQQQQQKVPPGPPLQLQQQQVPQTAWGQRSRPPGPQQQPQGAPGLQQQPQQQQQHQVPWQQPRPPPGLPLQLQQQQVPQTAWGPRSRLPGPQQQPQGAPGLQQQPQQQGPPGMQQQQQQQGPWQQRRPPGPQQQPQGAPGLQQQPQQQGPPGMQQQQQQQGPWQQRRPPGPQQQPQGAPGLQQQPQQQGPPGMQQQPQQQQGPPGLQQQQQQQGPWQQRRPPGPQQQQQKPQPQQVPQQVPQQQPQIETIGMETLKVSEQQRPHGSGDQQQKTSKPQQPTGKSQEKIPVSAVVPKRSGKSNLSTDLQQMYISQIPKRSSPGGGKAGRPISVETNMMRLNFKSNMLQDIVHYDVVIDPDKPKFLMRPVFEAFRQKHFPKRYPAFDGKKNAYSAKNLPFGDRSPETEVTVFDPERQTERTFKMFMQKVAVLDLTWLMHINFNMVEYQKEEKGLQALDIILRNGQANRFTTVGRSLFPEPEPGRVVSLTNGVQLWVGVFQSAVIGWRPYLNIDIAHKGFPTSQPVINLMKELCTDPRNREPPADLSKLSPSYTDKINKFLKGLKIQYEIPGQPNSRRTYRVNALSDSARRYKFQMETGTSTVENYFAQVKKYRLQYPELPCLWVGSRTSDKRINLPVELCTIVAGQVTQKKLDPDQTAKMIRETATDTHKRKAKIMGGFAKMNMNAQPTLMNEFKLSVQGEFEKVPARVLQPPRLQYNEREVNVMKGVWRANRFLQSSSLPDKSWTILNLDRYVKDNDLYILYEKLLQGGSHVGMHIGKPETPFLLLDSRDYNKISQYFYEKKQQKLKLVVVVLPNVEHSYSVVKQFSEIRTAGGVLTQCLKSQTLRKLSEATITNILLKINSKLNGINHVFTTRTIPSCMEQPCIVIGADVTHPSPTDTNIPSIAAVAASCDPKAFQYRVELRLQSPREEMIQDLQAIMCQQLIHFRQKTGYKPSKIIFYRDGVSEGQLPQVMHYELNAIKAAIMKLEKSTQHSIPITFLVVQKRHHIRLFPTDAANSDDRNFNVQAGTIVDTEITHPIHIDFYLVSHASIQGTARPTKYRCICNESRLSEDQIEQLTYYLCHMFARCTRSVSYPAPTYYAHLAAFRARAWIHNVELDIDNLPEEQRRKMNMQMESSPMFFV